MRLKKISLQGFKSFADKTVLQFDEGITCIVGPNGCGKSNISDAFRWVLGEQSAKSMRGSKMPDIIFAGASKRKPVNFAEVSLTLTDIESALPIEYEEITITRRLHRSGDSEYLLNGNQIRLKDLQALFLGSGVGKNAFSIFEQGKMDDIIHSTPLERRAIFEEASGILRFLQSKKESLRRLEQADLNFSRLQDIRLEIEKQILLLEDQAKKARKYKELKTELELTEKTIALTRWKGIEKKQSDFLVKQNSQQLLWEESKCKCTLLEEKFLAAKTKRQANEKALRSHNEQLMSFRSKKEIQMRDCQMLQERIMEDKQREKKIKLELEELNLAKHAREKLMGSILRKKNELEIEWNASESNWTHQKEIVKELENEISHLRSELSQAQHAHLKGIQQNSHLQSELKQSQVRLENIYAQIKQTKERIDLLKQDEAALNLSKEERKQSLKKISSLVDNHKERLEIHEEDLKQMGNQEENIKLELNSLHQKLIEYKARQKVLLKLREEMEGFSHGSKTLLQEASQNNSPLYQKIRPLYEYFNPDSNNAEACAVILKAYSHTLVIETSEEMQTVLDFAAKHLIHDFSLFCLEWAKKAISQTKLSITSTSSPFNFIPDYFLGETQFFNPQNKIVEDWIQGTCKEGWSNEKTFLDQRGVLFKINPGENQVFLRESELKKLEEYCAAQEDLLSQKQQIQKNLQQRKTILQQERAEIDKILRRDEIKLVEINFSFQKAISDLEKNKTDLSNCENSLISFEQKQAEQQKQHTDYELRHAKEAIVLQDLQSKEEFLKHVLSKQEATLRIHESDQKEKGQRHQLLIESRQEIFHQEKLLASKEQDHFRATERIDEELHSLNERKQQFKQDEEKGKANLSTIEELLLKAAEYYSELEKGGAEIDQQCEDLSKELSRQLDEVRQCENTLTQIDMQLSHLRAVSQTIIEELSEKYHLSIQEALQLEIPLNRSLEQLEKQIKFTRLAIQECGDVNLAAIEELERQQERISLLKQQIDDLQNSRMELLTIIKNLEKESTVLFNTTFEAIRINFKKNFQILFNGGEADLELTDPHNILEAGVEISAKPPGKQMRSITLLSGGEKCLTAVALLFAIFEVKPAPFCILDEIDAPLDDTNVERFLNVVKHFVDRCQFLIITHNKRTMSLGDVLFGVSMEEKGVSKLLSLEFSHRKNPEEFALLVE